MPLGVLSAFTASAKQGVLNVPKKPNFDKRTIGKLIPPVEILQKISAYISAGMKCVSTIRLHLEKLSNEFVFSFGSTENYQRPLIPWPMSIGRAEFLMFLNDLDSVYAASLELVQRSVP